VGNLSLPDGVLAFERNQGAKMKYILIIIAILGLVAAWKFIPRQSKGDSGVVFTTERKSMGGESTDTATFGAGCFWCVEAVFQELKGVKSVTSGYSGGDVPNPTYKQVCTGTTGHAEVSQIVFDPAQISYPELLEVFWKTHDPTMLNRQGNDVGTQYRSAIFYHSDEQRRLAEHYKKELDSAGAFDGPIVTEIVPYTVFYKAEDYHQNYYNENGDQPYCQLVIRPKVEKFRKAFGDRIKGN
jgi:peptide-methionine (S)-S-oxide reductase